MGSLRSVGESFEVAFTVRGTLTVSNRVFRSTNYTVKVIPFILDRRGASWRLSTQVPYQHPNGAKGVRHKVAGYEGGDIFGVSTRVPDGAPTQESSLPDQATQASVTAGPIQSFRVWDRVIWFAFVGHNTSPTDFEMRIVPLYPWPGEKRWTLRSVFSPPPRIWPGRLSFTTLSHRSSPRRNTR